MAEDGTPRVLQDLGGAYEMYRDTVIHDMRSKFSQTVHDGNGSNEDNLGMAIAREHGLLLQVGQEICGIRLLPLACRRQRSFWAPRP